MATDPNVKAIPVAGFIKLEGGEIVVSDPEAWRQMPLISGGPDYRLCNTGRSGMIGSPATGQHKGNV